MTDPPVEAETSEPEASQLADELNQLRAERDALTAELASRQRRQLHGVVVRRGVVGVFVALFAILLPLAVTTGWVHRTVLNTDTYVKTVTPIAANPTVTESVSRQLTDQLYAALQPQAAIADALPPRAAFLAGPIANGLKGFIQDRVNNRLNSPQFQQFWVQANMAAHTTLVKILRNQYNDELLLTSNGQVVLNLVPVLNAVLQDLSGTVSDIVGKNVQLPQLSGTELPSVACEKISAALGRPLPATCGQIPLFPEDKLTNAQRAVRAFDGLVLVLLIVVPLLAVAVLWISRHRRRTLIQLLVGGTLGLVVVRRVVMWGQTQLIATAEPENTASRTAVVHQVLHSFFDLTLAIVIGALILLALTLLTGPYRWARGLRDGVRTGAVRSARLVAAGVTASVGRARDERTLQWIRDHLDALRVAGIVVAVLLLLVLHVSFVGFLLIAALLTGYELWLYRLRQAFDIVDSAAPPPDAEVAEAVDHQSSPVTAGDGSDVQAPRSRSDGSAQA